MRSQSTASVPSGVVIRVPTANQATSGRSITPSTVPSAAKGAAAAAQRTKIDVGFQGIRKKGHKIRFGINLHPCAKLTRAGPAVSYRRMGAHPSFPKAADG